MKFNNKKTLYNNKFHNNYFKIKNNNTIINSFKIKIFLYQKINQKIFSNQ